MEKLLQPPFSGFEIGQTVVPSQMAMRPGPPSPKEMEEHLRNHAPDGIAAMILCSFVPTIRFVCSMDADRGATAERNRSNALGVTSRIHRKWIAIRITEALRGRSPH